MLVLFLQKEKREPDVDKIQVVTTLFPLYDFARNVGGDHVEVTLLLPPGVEPHSYEPTPKDIRSIQDSDIFIYTGPAMEPWAEKLISSLETENIVIDASEGLELIVGEHHDHEHEEHEEEHGATDPHIWLDFGNALNISERISQALIEIDPANWSYYNKNYLEYSELLIMIDEEYKTGLAACARNQIVHAGHYAFGYLSHRYNFSYTAAQGFSPDSEPSANDLIALTKQIRENAIEYIFYEQISSPKIAETVSNETGIKLLTLHTAENLSKQDIKEGKSYINIMEENLESLRTGMNCK